MQVSSPEGLEMEQVLSSNWCRPLQFVVAFVYAEGKCGFSPRRFLCVLTLHFAALQIGAPLWSWNGSAADLQERAAFSCARCVKEHALRRLPMFPVITPSIFVACL